MGGDSDASELVYDAALEKLEECKLEMERSQLRNEQLKHELAELEANAPPMSELQARKATFEGDKHKFMQLIANLEAHQSKQEQKLEQAVEEKTQREAEQARLESELSALKVGGGSARSIVLRHDGSHSRGCAGHFGSPRDVASGRGSHQRPQSAVGP